MRVFVAAAVMIALLTVPAYSQQPAGSLNAPSGRRGPPGPIKPAKTAAELKAEEAAYKAALERIPSAEQKYDPWASVRK
jgi:hypothetical protein